MRRLLILTALGAALAACAPTIDAPQTSAPQTKATQTQQAELPAELTARLNAFDAHINAQRFDALLDFTPPKMVAQQAARSGLSAAEFRKLTNSMITGLTSMLTLEGNFQTSAATMGQTRDGAPYALIPTETSVTNKDTGRTEVSKGVTLAFQDGGVWYLVRLRGAQNEAALRQSYPRFNGVALPRPGGNGAF